MIFVKLNKVGDWCLNHNIVVIALRSVKTQYESKIVIVCTVINSIVSVAIAIVRIRDFSFSYDYDYDYDYAVSK